MFDIVIVGGGLAGLINAIQLSKANLKVCLVEKKQYPFHKVCGEYISNEVVPFLKSIDAFPDFKNVSQIHQLTLSDTRGEEVSLSLPLGGFGISRYILDEFFYQKALAMGTEFLLGLQATDIQFEEDSFKIRLSNGTAITSKLVIGSHGKRSKIDKSLNRDFIQKRSPYIGVKYHIHASFLPKGTIGLHNFKKGYCGVCEIEDNKFNVCYLSHRDNLRRFGSINIMEENILYQNPHLKKIFTEATRITKPIVINEIAFASKSVVNNHILMSGDAAGMIAPLCGNGMAMAIHSAKVLSELILTYYRKTLFDREGLEKAYTESWNRKFKTRLQIGRTVQRFFGHAIASALTVTLAKKSETIAKMIIRQTHGQPF